MVRKGNMKLIEFFEDGRLEMYNLEEDPGEAQNLAEINVDLAQQLHAELQQWRENVGAQYPSANPEYVP